MNNDRCLIQDMAVALAADPDVKAVRLDARDKQVSFAFMPHADEAASKKRLLAVVALHKPVMPDCTPGAKPDIFKVACEVCDRGTGASLPKGIVLKRVDGNSVILEKESCPTGPTFWKWSQFGWPKLSARAVTVGSDEHDLNEWKHAMAFAVVCGIFTITAFVLEKSFSPTAWQALVAYAIAYLAGAWHPAEEIWELLKKRVLDVHFLMLCVAAGAALIGHYWEGAMLLFLFSFSGALEHLAMARTQREIQSLFKAAPKETTVLDASGQERRVPVEQLSAGMTIRVRPGEQFAVDAAILTGTSAADESNLTGEAIPVEKKPGDSVFSGTLNLWGSLDLKVTRGVSESSLAKIITLIKEAQESKAPAQRFTDKFGTTYTYAILGLSLVMFLVWWLIMGHPAFTSAAEPSAFYRAMTLLVVASPCALVLSIPSAILAGIAAGARRGILFRGGAAIEKLAEINRVALDKTGTLTTGEMEVMTVEACPGSNPDEVLRLAAALAHNSSHPVSRAIVKSLRTRNLELPASTDFRSLTGNGLEGTVTGYASPVRLGRRTLFANEAWPKAIPEPEVGISETLVQCGAVSGRILLRDTIRETSAPLLKRLYSAGLKVTMLTGDRQEAAERVASQLGLREFKAGLHPEDKVAAIKAWSAAGEKVAMVGDGVNDAPSLAAAHVAVGMGMRGSDAVLEQADVVLMQDRLDNFYIAYKLSAMARQIIRQNVGISLGVLVILVLSALGSFVPLTLGVIGHEGSTVIVVLNSLRLLFYKPE
ncbi:MAG: cation-translocating P-type ATPase [Verrucomicrobiota bacterium]|nr:cation-translocating P-type ATPase [Verrucomicrobiota bacterium]